MERTKVFHQGFFYRVSLFKDNVYYYKCHQVSCNGCLKVNYETGERTVTVAHSHGRNPAMTPTSPGLLEYKWL